MKKVLAAVAAFLFVGSCFAAPAWEKRHQKVTIELPASPPANLVLPLFDGKKATLKLAQVIKRSDHNYTWYGSIQGVPRSSVILTVVNGRLTGFVDLGGKGRYSLRTEADGSYGLTEIDQQAFPAEKDAAGVAAPPKAATTANADSGATIDVMVLFSNQTGAALGSSMDSFAQQAVDLTNQAYANSGVATRLNLVHDQQVNQDEDPTFTNNLDWVTNDPTVAALRNTYGADLVSYIIDASGWCGYAWLGPGDLQSFSAVNRGCALGNLSFPHETAHNFGAHHDLYVDTSGLAYAHGWVDCAEGWRTVMAYPTQCGGTRLPYFSNPSLSYGDPLHPMGDANTANNTRVLNEAASTVANMRASVVGGTCTYAISPSSASVPAAGGSGNVSVLTQAGCAWTAGSTDQWVHLSPLSGTGQSDVAYSVDANTGAARNSASTIAGLTFSLSQASGAPAIASIAPASLQFGNVKIGKTSVKTASVSNTGGANSSLVVNMLAQTGSNDFVFTTNCLGATLYGGQSCTVTYTYKPSVKGATSASLTVATSVNPVMLSLSGSGVGGK